MLRVLEESAATTRGKKVLRDALERYHQPDGYVGHLVEAAWQLEQSGADAWPVLRELVLEGAPECESFLGAIVRVEGVTRGERLVALLAAARNPDANVRSRLLELRLLELLDEMPDDPRGDVLRELAAEERPDDDVTDRAREVVRQQAS